MELHEIARAIELESLDQAARVTRFNVWWRDSMRPKVAAAECDDERAEALRVICRAAFMNGARTEKTA